MKRLMFIYVPIDLKMGAAADVAEFLKTPRSFQKAIVPSFIGKRHSLQTLNIKGYRCHVVEPKDAPRKSRPVILFLHGGAFMMEASSRHCRMLDTIIQKTGAKIWVLEYPQLPKANVIQSLEAVIALYKHVLNTYTAVEITVCGDSAGAALAITMCHWLKKYDAETPMPKKMVLLSPGQLKTENLDIRAAMRAMEAEDMIALRFLDATVQLMALPSDSDDFYLKVFEGDFSGFPPLHIFSGTRETFYPQVKDFVPRLERNGVSVYLHEGLGMCHDWMLIPFAKESKAALSKIADILLA